jgi:sugar phosphate isomerase/epimerase
MYNGPVALQLYTVRDETARDFAGTVRRVAEMGYTGVEFAGYGQLSAPEMVDLLAETGLRAAGTHVGLAELSEERLAASIAYCRAIHCPTLILPWLAPELRTFEHIATLAPRLNAIGQQCHAAGLLFGYHNHNFEFVSAHGRTWLDALLEATDPALVRVELDVYWAAFAGHDPLTLLHRLGTRVALLHCKDMAPDRSMTEVGQGTLDMPGMLQFAQQHGIWAVVEHDHPTLPSLQSARTSLGYFQ